MTVVGLIVVVLLFLTAALYPARRLDQRRQRPEHRRVGLDRHAEAQPAQALGHRLRVLAPQRARVHAERGIAEMMVDLYRNFASPLTEAMLFCWHQMLMEGDRTIGVVGGYRRHEDPMQVVSGPDYKRVVHFEAPPSSRVAAEMASFISWFNDTGSGGRRSLPPLTRAGLAHLYFVSVHPFEDGNGRIARAIAERALAQALGRPSQIGRAHV